MISLARKLCYLTVRRQKRFEVRSFNGAQVLKNVQLSCFAEVAEFK